VRTGDRAEGQDDGDEADAGGDGVLQELQADVGGQVLGLDAGSDDDDEQQCRADELGECPEEKGRCCG
jgi:hypothetical protein